MAAIDGYLLDGHPSKARAIEALLAARSDDQKAAPFYRALEMVGARAADEALIALRLVLAGVDSDDEHVKRLRGLVKTVRAGGSAADGARAAYAAEIRQSPDGGNR
ncbi:MAG TPA: hypothetical protein VN905_05270 [Candidatus Binatia bacterium]|nr:hypothetical protein [Candidatus Binatia bacterium]